MHINGCVCRHIIWAAEHWHTCLVCHPMPMPTNSATLSKPRQHTELDAVRERLGGGQAQQQAAGARVLQLPAVGFAHTLAFAAGLGSRKGDLGTTDERQASAHWLCGLWYLGCTREDLCRVVCCAANRLANLGDHTQLCCSLHQQQQQRSSSVRLLLGGTQSLQRRNQYAPEAGFHLRRTWRGSSALTCSANDSVGKCMHYEDGARWSRMVISLMQLRGRPHLELPSAAVMPLLHTAVPCDARSVSSCWCGAYQQQEACR